MTQPAWRKASRSSTTGGDCVEVADFSSVIGVRDSRAPDAGHLALSPKTFSQLIAAIKRGELHS
ncbi:DUF397 domain-containing protein [Actinomadura madurae]|uniref:DUF397 domain-containing protein n=1 Tax=Actinomadura madurae TaxID=1993 RepID=A0A1I5NBJ2_9ACTN|nr:DUF397 domain-containing protein [Actinomadura madurae]SFP18736.1 protein of unknown function [Actinomadura madurae]SPT50232.1 Domain of uncharacterised function (DUF397) [Actinomadura madurae]